MRHLGEFLFSGQAMHHAQLNDMQPVIERARHHRQTCAGLLVERPESQVIALQIVQQGSHSPRKHFLGRFVGCGKEVILNAPKRPDETVENVRRWRHDVFLEPKVAGLVGESDSTLGDGALKAHEGTLGRLEIERVPRFLMSAHQRRNALPLR
jgi:hypothetical protein